MKIKDEILEIEKIIRAAVERLKEAQHAHCPERNSGSEIAEANLTHYLSWSFNNSRYNVYPEFPASNSRCIDMVGFHNYSPNWVAIEAKNFLHSNQNKVLKDFERLDSLNADDWVDGSKVIKVFITFNRHPNLSKWWKDRDDSRLSGVKAYATESGSEDYSTINKYLKKVRLLTAYNGTNLKMIGFMRRCTRYLFDPCMIFL